MAESIQFDGMNRHFQTPPADPEVDLLSGAPDMFGYNNGVLTFTRWKLSSEEMEEIIRTGEIWLAVRTGTRPIQPHWLGSLSFIKQACADFGRLWRAKPKVMMIEGPKNEA